MITNEFVDNGLGNSFDIHPTARIDPSVKINIEGGGHRVVIGEHAVLRNLNFNINGSNNTVIIGARCKLRGSIHVRQVGSILNIGGRTSAVGVHWFAMEGKEIRIGEDCMFSSGIYVRTSDEHPMYDLDTNIRINDAQNIVVGTHVWVGEGATLNKGCFISDGCVIGARAFVSKKLSRPNAVYAGAPARLVRERVRWERHLPPMDS